MRLRILDKEKTKKIHKAAVTILQEIGIDVRDRETRSDLLNHGCKESDTGYVLFPEDLVHRALETVPQRFTLYDRNGNLAVDTDDAVPHFAPGLNAVTILDPKTGKQRECVLRDITDSARVCDRLHHIDMASGLGNPSDVSPEAQAIETVKAIMEQSGKPFPFIAHNEIEDEEVWNHLKDVAGGWEELADAPFALDLTGPYSPLELGEEACRRLRFTARHRLPVVCYPAMIPGTTGPVTLDGAIAQSSAEILGGLVVHQLSGPGSPVITASAILPMDLRTGGIVYGSPEYMMVGLGAVDYFRDLGVPTWIGAGCSDSHTIDAQAAAEAGMNMHLAVLAGTSFVHNLGFLSAGKSASLEMLVLADELAGSAKRFAGGIPVSKQSLGIEVTKRNYQNHQFMMDDHTLEQMHTAMWEPRLFNRSPYEKWEQAGAVPLAARLKETVLEIIG